MLFKDSSEGKAAAEAAAASFNSYAPSLRRTVTHYPPSVDPRLGARVYTYNAGTTAGPVAVMPTGMEVLGVQFEPACAETGCWAINVAYTTGTSDAVQVETFNSFYLPYAVGSDSLSYDYNYADNDIMSTFAPANFPCGVSDYVAADGSVASLPVAATGCCFGTGFDIGDETLGGDGDGKGVLGQYRVTESFASYASTAYSTLCPGGYDSPNIDTSTSNGTPKPEDAMPSTAQAQSFIAPTAKFVGMPNSPGFTRVAAEDAWIGQYTATVKLDEKELRTKAGLLSGTVGVEHTVDFFVGYVNFRPATGSWIFDSFATQAAIHVEKTRFFSVSTHGVNDYT